MRNKQEIDEQIKLSYDYEAANIVRDGYNYERGVRDALDWITFDHVDPPFTHE